MLINRGRIGALVTAKPLMGNLRGSSGISGLHVRGQRMVKIAVAENNLKRAGD